MIYLLGGPPRVGKSIMATAITSQYGISAISTDSLGVVLETVLNPETEPGLFAISRFNELAEADRMKLMVENPTKRIDYQRREGMAVWRAVEPFILREQDEGRDLVVEGVAVLPELVAQLEGIDYRTVFVGNQGEHHYENLKKSAEENAHDWMHDLGDPYLRAFALFVKRMSAYIEKEAKAYGFEYIEMDNARLGDVTEAVMTSLGLSTRSIDPFLRQHETV